MTADVGGSVRTAPLSVSVVVPVYDGEHTLATLAQRIGAVFAQRGESFEIVFVNDGSSDGSWDVIRSLAETESHIRGIDLMRNYGQHNAILAGVRAACGSVVLTIDDDLQNPPEEIPALLDRLSGGYDVVYGVPVQERHDLWRVLASQLTKLVLQGAMGAEIAQSISSFRAFRTQLRDGFASYQSPLVSIDVLLTWSTRRFAAVRVRHEARTVGHSRYTVRKLVLHALNLMTGFSALPLRLASIIGFLLAFFGVALLLFVLIRFFTDGSPVPGFPFLAAVISIFSGAQLFALGIIGEYLARVHFRTLEQPPYVVRRVEGGTGEAR